MFGNNDLEAGVDSSSEVRSPMVAPSPPKPHDAIMKQQSKVLMMSTTDRSGGIVEGESSSGRMTIATKKVTWEKSCKRFGSLCMAVFLFAGGIVSLEQQLLETSVLVINTQHIIYRVYLYPERFLTL